jgi:hypothetical protein
MVRTRWKKSAILRQNVAIAHLFALPCSAEYLNLWVRCNYNSLSEAGLNAVTRGVQEGRGGKGIIFVFAAGTKH